MPTSSTRSAFLTGMRHGVPFLIVVVPFGMLFGVVATEAGLDVLETMVMSALVIAGASQFATLELLGDGAPAFIAVLTGLAVNMRMAMYSASITPHLGKAPLGVRAVMAYFLVDQVYALSIQRFTDQPGMTLAQKTAYYFGVIAPVCPFWYIATWLGVVVGAAIPDSYALDFAVPIAFVAVVAPMLRGLPNLLAAGTAIIAALALAGLPYNTGLILSALAGMFVGAFVETRLAPRSAQAAA
ncbi:MAG: putative branched-subunit amino acid permease [Paracoccaceae bacterium]|jgi:predicted branched-subunit amino acid permease